MFEQEINRIKAHPITGKLLANAFRIFVGTTMTLNLEWKTVFQIMTEIITVLIRLQLMDLKISMHLILKFSTLVNHKSDDIQFIGIMPIMWAQRIGFELRFLVFFILPCDMNHIEFLKNKSRVDNREDMTIQVISIH